MMASFLSWLRSLYDRITMRPSTPIRVTATSPVRNIGLLSSTGVLKPYVTSTSALSTNEMNVVIAYLTLFGKTPDRAALAYWSSYASTLADAVDSIRAAVSGALIFDADPGVSVALVYYHLFGRVLNDDPAGQAYWTSVLVGTGGYGAMVQTIYAIGSTSDDYYGDTLRNRALAAESVARLQKSQAFDLSGNDARSAVLRVVGAVTSYDAAMVDIYRLLVSRVASTPMSWGQSLTDTSLYSDARTYDNSSIRQHRYLVWYNRSGDMMRATVYLPPNFVPTSSHRGIIALHGGGWRQGYPEVIYDYCTQLASGTDPSYVVLAPTYRLTAHGGVAPGLQNDVADFYSLVNAATRFKLSAGKVSLFGESSGAHLACLLGATQNVHRVLGLYPPINLTGATAVSPTLDPYVDYYASGATQTSSSADLQWASGRTTPFQLWHGLSDGFVPSAQTADMVTAAGAYCVPHYLTGEGHGFTYDNRQNVINAARVFFDDRNPL